MADPQIVPHKITKPIQLLAAWLAGLAVINGSFLAGAGTIHNPSWIPALLAIAAVVNVPLFILSLFLLQTRFRPEMQEDTFYSKYLERKYSHTVPPQSRPIDLEKQFRMLADDIVHQVSETKQNREDKIVEVLKESEIYKLTERFASSRSLSELYLNRDRWEEIVVEWENDESFNDDVSALFAAGLVTGPSNGFELVDLTPIGREVASRLEKQEKLWNQTNKRFVKGSSKKRRSQQVNAADAKSGAAD